VSTEISASNGQRMLAMTVFSHALSFFRSRALLEINDQSGAKVASDDIRWIVTVPAIWHDPAKQFMRRAAYQVRTFATSDLAYCNVPQHTCSLAECSHPVCLFVKTVKHAHKVKLILSESKRRLDIGPHLEGDRAFVSKTYVVHNDRPSLTVQLYSHRTVDEDYYRRTREGK